MLPWGWTTALIVLSAAAKLPGCEASPPRRERAPQPIPAERWGEVESFLYQLQRSNAQRIGETAFDLVITTIDVAGSSAETVPALKRGPGGAKLVLAYMSIGQAEDYRFYWKPSWEKTPPPWLDASDPNWRGDFWVRYWDPGWQRIIYGTPDSYLDRIIALGFDGVYLDRVDAYAHYERRDGRSRAAAEMVEFVMALSPTDSSQS